MTGHVFLQPSQTSPDPLTRFGRRDLQRRLPGCAFGAVAGMTAGFLLVQLGVNEALGSVALQIFMFTGALVGTALGFFRLQWVIGAIDLLLIVLFLIIADTPLMYNVAHDWVREDKVDTPLDAIIVLSATVNSDGILSDQGVQRLLTGIQLFQSGVAPRIFTTAVEESYGSVLRSSTVDQERLITLGGAHAAWSSLTGVYTTRDEAMQAASQLPAGAHSVAVVTAPMHTRRACATFEAVGFRVICVPSREQEFVAWHPLDSRDRLEAFRQYFYERLGMVKYRAKGWLPKGD